MKPPDAEPRSLRPLRPRAPLVAAGVVVLGALPVGGCVASPGLFAGPPVTSTDGTPLLRPAPTGWGLVVDDRSPLPDVPVPLRFVLVPSRSAASASTGAGVARGVTHVYQGRAGYDQLSTFFSDQLGRHGWQPDPAGPASGPIRAYIKGPEQLHLSLSEARGVATVSVHIAARPMPVR